MIVEHLPAADPHEDAEHSSHCVDEHFPSELHASMTSQKSAVNAHDTGIGKQEQHAAEKPNACAQDVAMQVCIRHDDASAHIPHATPKQHDECFHHVHCDEDIEDEPDVLGELKYTTIQF